MIGVVASCDHLCASPVVIETRPESVACARVLYGPIGVLQLGEPVARIRGRVALAGRPEASETPYAGRPVGPESRRGITE